MLVPQFLEAHFFNTEFFQTELFGTRFSALALWKLRAFHAYSIRFDHRRLFFFFAAGLRDDHRVCFWDPYAKLGPQHVSWHDSSFFFGRFCGLQKFWQKESSKIISPVKDSPQKTNKSLTGKWTKSMSRSDFFTTVDGWNPAPPGM